MLTIFRRWHELGIFKDSDAPPSEASTIHEWLLGSFDVLSVRDLAKHLDEMFSLGLERRELRELLRPARVRTVGDVATEIARQGWIPKAQPLDLAGRPCLAAGWFLLLCERHRRSAGKDAGRLAPSTDLADALRRPGVAEALIVTAPWRFGAAPADAAGPPWTAWDTAGCLVSLVGRLLTPISTVIMLVVALVRNGNTEEKFDPRTRYELDGIPLTRFRTLGELSRQLAAGV